MKEVNEYAMIDRKKLWSMAKKGHSADELQQEFNIRDMAGLHQIMQELMRESGETIVVPGLVGQASLDTKTN